MVANPYNRYKQMQVNTTDPVRLVVMLYEGTILALKRAIGYIEKKDFENKGKELMRAQEILFELMSCLDHEKGGEVSEKLHALYTYMIKRVIEANVSLDITILQETIKHLETINEGWTELAKRNAAAGINKTADVTDKPSFESRS